MGTRKAEGFAAIPTWMIRDKSIPRSAVLVYAALASRSGLGGIFPGQGTIAEEAGVGERTARTMLAVLEDRGVIERYSRTVTGAGKGRSTKKTTGYRLHPNGRADVDEEPADFAGSSEEPAEFARGTGNERQITPLIEVEIDEVEKDSSTAKKTDVQWLCDRLAEKVRANGFRTAKVTPSWLDACDKLLRIDGYSVAQVSWMIDWATADSFWAANIRSMPTLREKFPQLVLNARRGARPAGESASEIAARMEAAS